MTGGSTAGQRSGQTQQRVQTGTVVQTEATFENGSEREANVDAHASANVHAAARRPGHFGRLAWGLVRNLLPRRGDDTNV
jgi:hypothetical protein